METMSKGRHHKGEAITLYRVSKDVMIMVSKRYDATVSVT